MTDKRTGILYIVSAPSGAGKTTLCKMAVDWFPGLRHSVSYTTRQPRPGEANGVEYWFVDDGAFDAMIRKGEFLEYAWVFGKRYGTSRKDLERLAAEGADVLLEIDVQGAAKVRDAISGGAYIFILPPSIEACRERLRARGKDGPEEIDRRLNEAVAEIRKALDYGYVIINDDLQTAFEELKAVIVSERVKRERTEARVRAIFGAYMG
ncbi:MAG: guanylate kinase [Deltaproteobacteria bacterium]|nr:guanylate kinase [Deltaproteobacteria bacterium]